MAWARSTFLLPVCLTRVLRRWARAHAQQAGVDTWQPSLMHSKLAFRDYLPRFTYFDFSRYLVACFSSVALLLACSVLLALLCSLACSASLLC